METDKLWPGDPARRLRWEQLMALLAPRPGESVLDVGCGGGAAVAFVSERVGSNGRAIGLDRYPERLAKIRVNYPVIGADSPTGVCAVCQALPFADESFDALLCVNVIEAVADRLQALSEMRRVLKPGGRILLAHDDWESLVYAGANRELTRRAVYAYANSKIQSYAACDGQMGRYLWGLFTKAGFVDADVQILPLINTEYREPLFGWVHAQFDAGFVAAVSDLTQAEIDRWHQELAAASEHGEYFFCANLYACLGRKPE